MKLPAPAARIMVNRMIASEYVGWPRVHREPLQKRDLDEHEPAPDRGEVQQPPAERAAEFTAGRPARKSGQPTMSATSRLATPNRTTRVSVARRLPHITPPRGTSYTRRNARGFSMLKKNGRASVAGEKSKTSSAVASASAASSVEARMPAMRASVGGCHGAAITVKPNRAATVSHGSPSRVREAARRTPAASRFFRETP